MGSVKVYYTDRGHEFWKIVKDFLEKAGVETDNKISEADLSIVLSGRFVNPLILNGKKVMAYDAMEWFGNIPRQGGFELYKKVLEEYYDDFIDLSGLNVQERVDKILEYIRGENV